MYAIKYKINLIIVFSKCMISLYICTKHHQSDTGVHNELFDVRLSQNERNKYAVTHSGSTIQFILVKKNTLQDQMA